MNAMTSKKDHITYTVLLSLQLLHQAMKSTVSSIGNISSLLPVNTMHTIQEVVQNSAGEALLTTELNESNQTAISTISQSLPVITSIVAEHTDNINTAVQAASQQTDIGTQFSIIPGDFYPEGDPWQTISMKQAGLIIALFALLIHRYSHKDVESSLNGNKPTYVS